MMGGGEKEKIKKKRERETLTRAPELLPHLAEDKIECFVWTCQDLTYKMLHTCIWLSGGKDPDKF